jgi:hypothetical protein
MSRLSRLPLHHLGLLPMTSRVDGGTYPGGWLTRSLRVNDKPDKVLCFCILREKESLIFPPLSGDGEEMVPAAMGKGTPPHTPRWIIAPAKDLNEARVQSS